MKFGSVCSGIEAASTAWEPLGWVASWFAEIEPFPCAVLAHHWPDTPNLGDFTAIRHKIASGDLEAPDVLVGGTPCQAFSVAGLRKSLDDQRGQLTIQFVGLADAIDDRRRDLGLLPAIIVWENVPGVLNTSDNAFGCFLAAVAGNDAPLVPPGGRWTDAGFVRGPRRTLAWRVQDAQYHGLAQRRRRVFLVASAGEGFRPEQVLFEFDGVRRDSPPCREPREGATPNASESTRGVPSHWSGGPHPTLNRGGVGGVGASNQEIFSQRGAMLVQGVIPLKCSGAEGANGADTGSIGDPCPTLDTTGAQGVGYVPATSPALRARDYKGTPQDVQEPAFVSYAIQEHAVSTNPTAGPQGKGYQPDLGYTLEARHHVQAVAFEPGITARLGGHAYPDVSGTLRKDAGDNQMAVAFAQNTRDEVRLQAGDGSIVGALAAEPGMKQTSYVAIGTDMYNGAITGAVSATLTKSSGDGTGSGPTALALNHTQAMQVRRLTPEECERLQGFPVGHTRIPWRGKAAEDCPDGPRYKALGNSMAVPCMAWIAKRIIRHLSGDI